MVIVIAVIAISIALRRGGRTRPHAQSLADPMHPHHQHAREHQRMHDQAHEQAIRHQQPPTP